MIQTPDSFVRFGKSNFEAALTVAGITLQSTERFVELQMRTAKEALEQSMRRAKAFSDARSAQDFVALQSKATQPSLEQALAYSRDIYTVAADAQVRIGKVLQSRIDEIGGEVMMAVGQATKSAPGADAAIAAFKSALGASNGVHAAQPRAVSHAKEVVAKHANGKRKTAKKRGR